MIISRITNLYFFFFIKNIIKLIYSKTNKDNNKNKIKHILLYNP